MAADYKTKYIDIRAKLLESTDVAYRLGYEEGMKEGEKAAQQQMEQQQMEQQMQQQQMMAQGGEPQSEEEAAMMAGGGEEGEPTESAAMMGEEEVPQEGEGSELDQSIGELEGLVSKGEKPKVTDIRKAVMAISSIRKNEMSRQKKRHKKIVSAQSKFVDNILKSWDTSTKDVTKNLEDVIKEHGLKID